MTQNQGVKCEITLNIRLPLRYTPLLHISGARLTAFGSVRRLAILPRASLPFPLVTATTSGGPSSLRFGSDPISR